MSESRIKKQRYWIAFLLHDLSVGGTFEPGVLHITVIPWFVTKTDRQEILEIFQKTFINVKAFDVKIGEQVNFGPEKDVSVNLLQNNQNILEIHKLALGLFNQTAGRWAVKNPYVGIEYVPHIRRREEFQLEQGNVLRLKTLTLVSASRQENKIRTVAAKVNFNV